MNPPENILTISALRKNTLGVLKALEVNEEPMTIFVHSKPVAVIMSISSYTQLRQDADPILENKNYSSAWDFLINPPESILIKKKGLNAVDLIRKDREEWINL